MWELDCEERWVLKNWCFWTMVLEKTLGSPLDCKEIQSVNPKGNQSWIFIGRTDAEAEAPVLWPPDTKSWLLEKTLMLGNIEGRRRRGWQRMSWLDGMSLSKLWEMVKDRKAWHAAVHGGHKESNTTEQQHLPQRVVEKITWDNSHQNLTQQGKEGGTNRESSTDIYTVPCVK